MFGNSKIKKCKKILAELKQTADKAENYLEKLEEKYGSKDWDGYFTGSVKKYSERYSKCQESNEKSEIVLACDKLDEAEDAVDLFIEGTYALAVYEAYSKKKPKLIRISTDEIYDWDTAFGTSFESIEKGLRHSLVGLVEEPARYKLK